MQNVGHLNSCKKTHASQVAKDVIEECRRPPAHTSKCPDAVLPAGPYFLTRLALAGFSRPSSPLSLACCSASEPGSWVACMPLHNTWCKNKNTELCSFRREGRQHKQRKLLHLACAGNSRARWCTLCHRYVQRHVNVGPCRLQTAGLGRKRDNTNISSIGRCGAWIPASSSLKVRGF